MLRQVANHVVKWFVRAQRRITTFTSLPVAYRCGANPTINESKSVTHSWMILAKAKQVRMKSADETFPFLTHSMQFTSPMNPFPSTPKMNSPVDMARKKTLVPTDICIRIFLTLCVTENFIVKQLQTDIHLCFL